MRLCRQIELVLYDCSMFALDLQSCIEWQFIQFWFNTIITSFSSFQQEKFTVKESYKTERHRAKCKFTESDGKAKELNRYGKRNSLLYHLIMFRIEMMYMLLNSSQETHVQVDCCRKLIHSFIQRVSHSNWHFYHSLYSLLLYWVDRQSWQRNALHFTFLSSSSTFCWTYVL